MATEIVFVVEEDPDGGLTAHAVGASIFTQADTAEQLRENVRDAVRCHYPQEPLREMAFTYKDSTLDPS